jgi:hypothetical protein
MIVTSSSNWRIPQTQNEVPLQIKAGELSHYLKKISTLDKTKMKLEA